MRVQLFLVCLFACSQNLSISRSIVSCLGAILVYHKQNMDVATRRNARFALRGTTRTVVEPKPRPLKTEGGYRWSHNGAPSGVGWERARPMGAQLKSACK